MMVMVVTGATTLSAPSNLQNPGPWWPAPAPSRPARRGVAGAPAKLGPGSPEAWLQATAEQIAGLLLRNLILITIIYGYIVNNVVSGLW